MQNNKLWQKPSSWSDPDEEEIEEVSRLLGKKPLGEFQIVVRDNKGNPQVIENAPFFFDGTPMPTRYWLVDKQYLYYVSLIESQGGVKQVQEQFSLDEIAEIHKDYEIQRDCLISIECDGPKPSGGVGGTRKGVKCLHAHLANYLVDGKDFVGKWTMNKIEKLREETNG